MSMCVPHDVFHLIPLFSLPQAGLAAVVGAHNVLNVSKQQQQQQRISASDHLAVGSDSTDRNLGVVGIVQGEKIVLFCCWARL